MASRALVETAVEYGNATSFWVEYPTGLIDISRSHHLDKSSPKVPPPSDKHLDVQVDTERTVRIDSEKSALVIIDMQHYFVHPEFSEHPTGLKCVDPLLRVIPALRAKGVKIIWVNWGLTDEELENLPPALVRTFISESNSGSIGFGSELHGQWGRLLMRDQPNSQLFGPLQEEFLKGKEAGSDVWIHKNRMSGIWSHHSALQLYLKENGISTLLFSGVNADQCVLGTLVDAFSLGYDCIVVKDTIATSSPEGGYHSVVYNAGYAYGFVSDTDRLINACQSK